MGFHVSWTARERYQFDESCFSPLGTAALVSFHRARMFAQRMNDQRDLVAYPEQAVKAGQINAMALICQILRGLFEQYCSQQPPGLLPRFLDEMYQKRGLAAIDGALMRFASEFPPLVVSRREMGVDAFLEGETGGIPHRQVVLQEMLMLWLSNANPAFHSFLELFDDSTLAKETSYPQLITDIRTFFAGQPGFGPGSQNVVDLLRAPALASPHSLAGQLEYILGQWGSLIAPEFYRLLGGLDLIKEEEKMIFPGGGPGPAQVVEFAGLEHEAEQFSPDDDWMPRLVLLAKNAYVWLDQLSRKYSRAITRLDEIPDEELDLLARWGFSGLWLIGLWERSRASQAIKQMCGNPDAVSSAYSLLDYKIAEDLGGEEACHDLRVRAGKRGIRLASDMVPNHMGIDSRWVIQHPDWFMSLDYSPFPTYTFNGPDLLNDERVSIYLEDHYFDRSDAAVVFKRVDRFAVSERYIYHGNDGTNMPWNDTAQLNYLIADVREALIQTIIHVARQFPVIRFDAAMTLAKKHFQRLWYPQPGTGGAIPSRAEHSMSREHFDSLMPQEFWREVVDRVAAEVPGTLLLAEAFWMMEGYFVRTLGMHRVYNSAFMNMLRDEENAKYRTTIKNTIEFDPDVLKRYVNFMNNPDEYTAVAQFGKDDKYFGICVMMATLPGLPMFGHGQIEGFAEKYGMEYRRAYWDEQADNYLIARHEREVFPLLHRRYLFAGSENFLLYDCYTTEGTVNEDVFAYVNRAGDERALVIFHNRFASAQGWLRQSAAYADKAADRKLVQKSLGEGLGLSGGPGRFCIFRDHVTGLEYVRNSREICEDGLFVSLAAYKCHVFLEFREVQDNASHQYAHLAAYLDGNGVPSISEALQEILLQPVHEPLAYLLNAAMIRRLGPATIGIGADDAVSVAPDGLEIPEIEDRLVEHDVVEDASTLLDDIEEHTRELLEEIKRFTGGTGDGPALAREIRREMESARRLPSLEDLLPLEAPYDLQVIRYLAPPDQEADRGLLFCWVFTHSLGRMVEEKDYASQSRSWLDEWLLGKMIGSVLRDSGLTDSAARRAVALIKILTSHQRWFESYHASRALEPYRVLESWLKDEEVQQFIQVNRYKGILWFNQESFEELLHWMFVVAVVALTAHPEQPAEETASRVVACYETVEQILRAASLSEFRVEKLLAAAMPVGDESG